MKKEIVVTIICFISIRLLAGQPNQAVLNYIDAYKSIAIKQMITYKIPASITLAQGILESGAGLSELAKESNNHFGIKCHNDWKGDKVYYDDDEENECFRKYKTVEDSYEDHAVFLSSNTRYEDLFSYDMDDYKAWAHGLKKAGYATNPKYDDILIGLIEDYNLDDYDSMTLADTKADTKKHTPKDVKNKNTTETKKASAVIYYNRIPTLIIKPGDTPEKIAELNDIWVWRLYTYNDIKKGDVLEVGKKFYLQPKRRTGQQHYHTVKTGETMWTISRDEGIRLDMLYKRNKLTVGQEPAVGEKLNLKGNRKSAPHLSIKNTPSASTPKKEEIKSTPKTNTDTIEFENTDSTQQTMPIKNAAEKEDKTQIIHSPSDTAPVSHLALPIYHQVEAKETLYSISKKYNTTIENIQKWNALPDANIKLGQQLIVGYN